MYVTNIMLIFRLFSFISIVLSLSVVAYKSVLFSSRINKQNRLMMNTNNDLGIKDRFKGKYCLNVTLYIKPERHEEFIECIKANQKGTLTTEPNAIQYTWGQSTTDKNIFHFHEQYNDERGFKEHTVAPHFKKWEEFANSNAFLKPPEVVFFQEYI